MDEEFPIAKYTVQLYYSPEKNDPASLTGIPPEQIASGVLIRNARRSFLVTCKHVFVSLPEI